MKVADEPITPKPDAIQQQRPGGFHVFIMPAQYRRVVVYHFVVNRVPGYVIQNAAETRYCIDNGEFQNTSKQNATAWEKLRTKEIAARCRGSALKTSARKAKFWATRRRLL
jgi:hypothetical protein